MPRFHNLEAIGSARASCRWCLGYSPQPPVASLTADQRRKMAQSASAEAIFARLGRQACSEEHHKNGTGRWHKAGVIVMASYALSSTSSSCWRATLALVRTAPCLLG